MSLINKVLSDLQKRGAHLLHAGESDGGVVPVRAKKVRMAIIAAIAVAVLALLTAGGLWWRAQHKNAVVQSPAPAKPISAPAPVAQPVAASEPVSSVEPITPTEPVASTPPPAAATHAISPPQHWHDTEAHAAPEHKPKPKSPSANFKLHKKPPVAVAQQERNNAPSAAQAPSELPSAAPDAELPDEVQVKQVGVQQLQADKEFRRGSGLMQQGRTEEALAAFRSALQIDAGFDAARQAMVGLLLTNGRTAEAERVLQDGLKLNPRHSSFAKQLARLQVERDAPWAALVTLQKTLPNAEPVAEIKQHGKSAATVGVDKRVKQITVQQQAENELRKAAELMRQGRVNEALAGYEAALQLDVSLEAARQAMIGLLLDNKRNSEAERVLRDGLKNNPKRSDYAMLLARLLVERDAAWSALLTLQKSLPYAERQADYQAFLAALLQRMNHHQEAISHYKVALQLAPNSGVWLMGLGMSLQAAHSNDEAREAYRHALETRSLSPELQAFVAQRMKEL